MHRVPEQIYQQADVLFSTFVLFQTIQYITKNKVMETESRELAAVSRGKIKVGRREPTVNWRKCDECPLGFFGYPNCRKVTLAIRCPIFW